MVFSFSTTPSTRFPQSSSIFANFVGNGGGKSAKIPDPFVSVIDIDIVIVIVFVIVFVIGIKCIAKNAPAFRQAPPAKRQQWG